jgi:hypothetical protein
MNILREADRIINERSEEKERQYGPMSETNRRAAVIASVTSNKDIDVVDLYNMQIALKLARESWSHKQDNLLDAVAYLGGLNNYLDGIIIQDGDVVK